MDNLKNDNYYIQRIVDLKVVYDTIKMIFLSCWVRYYRVEI